VAKRKHAFIVAVIALVLSAAAATLGVVMAGNAEFARGYVREQLRQQHITFNSIEDLTEAEKQSHCLVKYAGQLITTGKQAECYSNDFIGLHIRDVAHGQTYADLGAPYLALSAQLAKAQAADDPSVPELQRQLATLTGLRSTLFQGETSRGLLLTSFGFSDLGTKAAQAARVAYSAAGLLAVMSLGGLVVGLRAPRAAAVTTLAHEPHVLLGV
jgi:hypothetical protein